MAFQSGTSGMAAYVHSLLRIVIGFLFACHGAQKLLGMFGGMGGHGGKVALFSIFGLAGVLELIGGILIILGLLTRPVALILCGEMAVAYFQRHFPHSPWPIRNNGEPAVLYGLFFLYFLAAGAGPVSFDNLFFRGARK